MIDSHARCVRLGISVIAWDIPGQSVIILDFVMIDIIQPTCYMCPMSIKIILWRRVVNKV